MKRISKIADECNLDTKDIISFVKGKLNRSNVDRNSALNTHDILRLKKHFGLEEERDEPEEEPEEEPEKPIPVFQAQDDLAVDLSSIEMAKEPNYYVLCHEEVVDWKTEGQSVFEGDSQIARRTNLVMQHFMAHGKSGVVKGVKGVNKGWRRTPLKGCHYYLWWAPKDAPPVKEVEGPANAIYVRSIRHHDDHKPIEVGEPDDYISLTPDEVLKSDWNEGGEPWTEIQMSFVKATEQFRMVAGFPGTGKTAALWRTILGRPSHNVLYVTWSDHLAEAASEFLRQSTSIIQAQPFSLLLDRLAKQTEVQEPTVSLSQWLTHPLAPVGEWRHCLSSLVTEIRAYMVGSAVPAYPKQLEAIHRVRLSDSSYLEKRSEEIGHSPAQGVVRVVKQFEKENGPIERCWPELEQAFRAGLLLIEFDEKLQEDPEAEIPQLESFQAPDRIVMDEVQDLTSLELFVPIMLARVFGRKNLGYLPFFLCAGDEGQSLRATDFTWDVLNRLIYEQLGGKTSRIRLEEGLRCPVKVSELINRSYTLYKNIGREARPGK